MKVSALFRHNDRVVKYLVFASVQVGGNSMANYQIVGSNVEFDLGVSIGAVPKWVTATERWVLSHKIPIHYEHVGLIECGPVLHPVPKFLETHLGKVDIVLPSNQQIFQK